MHTVKSTIDHLPSSLQTRLKQGDLELLDELASDAIVGTTIGHRSGAHKLDYFLIPSAYASTDSSAISYGASENRVYLADALIVFGTESETDLEEFMDRTTWGTRFGPYATTLDTYVSFARLFTQESVVPFWSSLSELYSLSEIPFSQELPKKVEEGLKAFGKLSEYLPETSLQILAASLITSIEELGDESFASSPAQDALYETVADTAYSIARQTVFVQLQKSANLRLS